MNLPLRLLLIGIVVVGALGAAMAFTPHHSDPNPFITLFYHLIPAELVKDTHAEVAEPLIAIPLPGFLGFFTFDSHWQPTGELRVYNLQIFQVAAVLLIFACFLGVPRYVRTGSGDGIGKMFAGWAMWVRDEMVYPVMGKEDGRRFPCRIS